MPFLAFTHEAHWNLFLRLTLVFEENSTISIINQQVCEATCAFA